jgi:hypothetical protein
MPEQFVPDDPFLEQIRADWMKPHEWILIQGEMTTEDNVVIQNKLAKISAGQAKKKEFTLNLGDVMLAKLERMVKGWNIIVTRTTPDGSTREVPIPYSVQNIRKLPKRYTDFMDKEINKRNPDPDEDEQEAFLPSVVDSSEETSFETEKVYRLKSSS